MPTGLVLVSVSVFRVRAEFSITRHGHEHKDFALRLLSAGFLSRRLAVGACVFDFGVDFTAH